MIKWPDNKKFAFTVFDDTDNGTVDNLLPVYDLLLNCGIKTTKSVWAYPSRDNFKGECLEDKEYLDFIQKLQDNGFEIAWHGAGSGQFNRQEIIEGMEKFNSLLGRYPCVHANHAGANESIYWGYKRFVPPLSWLYRFHQKQNFSGEDINSNHFWGDLCKQNIQYIRNRTFGGINTGKYDKKMPYIEKSKLQYSNFWFSSSDGHTVEEFNTLISSDNVDKLEREGGFCIVYTHFASGFVNDKGCINEEFLKKITYLSQKGGWFVPCGTLLDFLAKSKGRGEEISFIDNLSLDVKWVIDRIIKKNKYGR